ncbi:hypothetical protein AB3S75_027234 [Citrus x aurantiifolia]
MHKEFQLALASFASRISDDADADVEDLDLEDFDTNKKTQKTRVIVNLRQRHPTLDMPVIDYDLALLFQPMLVLGISIGVAFNVILSTGTHFPFVCTTLL